MSERKLTPADSSEAERAADFAFSWSDHRHDFEDAWWHRVARTEDGINIWVRLCRVGTCSADEEFIGTIPDHGKVLTSVTSCASVTDVTAAEWKERP